MKKITLSDISQEDFDAAAETVSSGIKAYNRKLDTRDGTVLRDLLVNPEAAIEAVIEGQISEARKSSSLKMMKDAQDSGEQVDDEDVKSILSNFNITPASGKFARGIVKVVVSDGAMAYSIPEGAVFSTADELSYSADSQVIAAPDGIPNPGVVRTTKLYEGAAGYFFLVPVTAVEIGSAGNITQGTSLDPESGISSFVMAEAYKDFDGGTDVQDLGSVIKSIPSGLSIRGFVNKTAVEGMLRSEFDGGDFPIIAVSSVGYGNKAQVRDRHNVFGVGVGGRVDVYVRNFSDVFTDTKTLVGKRVTWEDGSFGYEIEVPYGTFPGACWIKSVADPFRRSSSSSSSDVEEVLESLAIVDEDGRMTYDGTVLKGVVRTADVSGTWHDIDVSDGPAEAFNTIWQGFRIAVDNVPPDISEDDSSSGNDEWSETREFKVTAYCLPQAVEIQEYVDRDDVRSVSTDVVVRCPILCLVSVNANVKYDPKNPIDETVARSRIRSYINGLGFVGRLTRSEIVQILKNLGAASVEMPDKDMLYGLLHDADGARHVLSGDALDVQSADDGSDMLTKDTVVFVTDDNNIQINLTPNS